ncbi:unnamed protein product [Linum trigynum]|uniref:F-box domain-containing protein n=1 Tax=Linum trigynum TaxID=586398 RepID=A0AAV2EH09_9ROSI
MNQDFPQDLITDILWRLPIGPWTGRFCCVCKSWRTLFSDPSFILREKPVDSGLRILINSFNDDKRSVYSLHSADTLEPLLPCPLQLPFNEEKPLKVVEDNDHCWIPRFTRIAGSCNGLICIADGDYDLILWNPATSETKLVPPSPFRPNWHLHTVGFGFDPETEDYKIIRQFELDDGSWGCSYFLEVYCLRTDSWTKLTDDDNRYHLRVCYDQMLLQCNKGKLYWWRQKWNPKCLEFESFAISSHEFRTIDLRLPSGIEVYGKLEYLLNEEYMVALFPLEDKEAAEVRSYASASMEIWVLLKYWVPESWTKLLVIANPPPEKRIWGFSGISRNLKWLFLSFCDYRYSYLNQDEFLVTIRPETGNFNDFYGLDIPTRFPVTVINYMPSRVCLRDYCAPSS